MNDDERCEVKALTQRGQDFYFDLRREGASHDDALRDANHSYGRKSA